MKNTFDDKNAEFHDDILLKVHEMTISSVQCNAFSVLPQSLSAAIERSGYSAVLYMQFPTFGGRGFALCANLGSNFEARYLRINQKS